ncbi:MAG: GNAT family N-acetyltransferase [Prevotella sp.]|nr:GNAT family N-acetyltransferase [Prevotella sp.]
MRLELATKNDFDAIIAFYDDVTERTPEMGTYVRWQKGKHPTEEGISAYINEGSMYIYRERGVIVGAMAVTMYQGEAIRLAQNNGMQAIRLDALASNTPAHKIYERLGFEYRGKQHLYAANTGWTDFYFFEYKSDNTNL